MTIKEIVRRTGYSRGLVRQVLRGQRNDVFRSRESSLEPYLEWLDAQWAAGRRNGTELWRRLRKQGFRGSRRVVSEWATRRKRADKADADTLTRTSSARTISPLNNQQRQPDEIRNRHHRRDRKRRPAAHCGPRYRLPRHGSAQNGKPAHAVDRPRSRQSGRLLWQRRRERHSGGSSGDRLTMVQWADRRADNQAQAGKTPNVRTRKA